MVNKKDRRSFILPTSMKIGSKKGVAPLIVIVILLVVVGAVWYYNSNGITGKVIGDPCLEDSDCDPGEICYAGLCDEGGFPGECVDDSDCGVGEVCNTGVCEFYVTECLNDDDCAMLHGVSKPVCNNNWQCVPCYIHTDCSDNLGLDYDYNGESDFPFCQDVDTDPTVSAYQCVECVLDSDCDGNDICDSSYTCVNPNALESCELNPGEEFRVNHNDCSGTSVVDPYDPTNTIDTPHCYQGVCSECYFENGVGDSCMSNTNSRMACDYELGACVECSANVKFCTGDTLACDEPNLKCVYCVPSENDPVTGKNSDCEALSAASTRDKEYCVAGNFCAQCGFPGLPACPAGTTCDGLYCL